MMIKNVSQGNAYGLPNSLITAQAAMNLPEVQEMLQRLSKYQLGIFMPHIHDEKTGQFQPLDDDVMQVESGLQVCFKPTEVIAAQSDPFLPVAWLWRGGVKSTSAACEMVRDLNPDEKEWYGKHKMIRAN